MGFEITQNTQNAASEIGKTPQLILKVDGVDTIYGSGVVVEIARYGDPELVYGMDGLVFGGSRTADGQETLITLKGTTTSIQQQLRPDQGAVSSVSSMQLVLVDKSLKATELITPGEVVDDLLGRRCKVYLGFEGVNYPEDFIVIFRGIVDDIISHAGNVVLNIAHPDQKKRQEIFLKVEQELSGSIDDSDTTITLADASDLLQPVTGPDGTEDTSIKFYIRVDDEIIQYDAISGNDLTGCTRGALGTTAAAHEDEASVTSFYRLTGNSIDLALKIMLSGWNDYFTTGVAVESFNQISAGESVDNAIFFVDVDIAAEYGIVIGDYVTTTGDANGANNVSLKPITNIVKTDLGSYIEVGGSVSFVTSLDSDATVSFRSQYDTLGEGLKMYPDEVDVTEHLRVQDLFLSSFNYDFYLKDQINGKEFLEKEIYFPAGAYPLPRKSQASVGFHSGPVPGTDIKTLDKSNITSPSKMPLRRTISRNFYNTVTYKFDEDALTDNFLSGVVYTDEDSKARIEVGSKILPIVSKGLREDSQGFSLSSNIADRLLNRYKFAAEFFEQVEVLYETGFNLEVGDIVLFDGTDLFVTNTAEASRRYGVKFFEIINKTLDIKTGKIRLSLLDTNYSTQSRYGLISPASFIKSGSSNTTFVIKESFGGNKYGANEYLKWSKYVFQEEERCVRVRVRSADFSTVSSAVPLVVVAGNTMTVASSLGFTPTAGMIMEMAKYDDQTDQVKALFTFMSDGSNDFDDGGAPYRML